MYIRFVTKSRFVLDTELNFIYFPSFICKFFDQSVAWISVQSFHVCRYMFCL